MSVKVPINKPKSKRIQQKRPEKTEQSFLQRLNDEGRLVIAEGSRTTDGEVVAITPVNGTTFYFLGASCSSDQSAVQTKQFTLSINGIDKETLGISDQRGFAEFRLKTASVVGNDTNNIAIDTDVTSGGTAFASIWGYNENTPSTRSGN